MASPKITPPKYFLIFPTGREIYAWEIRDTRVGTRPISKHKYLGFATLEAERLNRVVHEKELARQRAAKVICISVGQRCFQEGCQLQSGHLGWHSTTAQSAPDVSSDKGQMSERQLSESYVRGLIDSYNRGCDFGEKDDL